MLFCPSVHMLSTKNKSLDKRVAENRKNPRSRNKASLEELLSEEGKVGGVQGIRTLDPYLAKVVLSQLS